MVSSFSMFGQGVTTSSMSGQVLDQNGEGLIAVNVTAVHTPTGTFYGTSTDVNGSYRIDNMKVGGPYTITASYVGFDDVITEDVTLRLGERAKRIITMGESSTQLDAVTVVAKAGSVGSNSGSSTQISTESIESMPTINRSLNDYLRLTPQSSSFGGGTTFAGTNNRFNAIYVDGAVNNDVFGLAGSGTNGGQTGISPFSIDIIDQFQVVLSPYDVTLGGFAGGGVNAVTKSGKNDFFGTAYFFYQDQDLVGETNENDAIKQARDEEIPFEEFNRTEVAPFSKKTYGASIGGPIVKDKAFFFVNAEIQKDETPTPFNPASYSSSANRASIDDLDGLRNFLMNTYNYDPGTFGDTSDELEGLKLFGKIDINLNAKNKLTLRHQYTNAENFNRNSGSSNTINFSNNGEFFPSTTNSSALELNTTIGEKMSNNLIIGYTSVNDDRGSLGSDFPFVIIDDAGGQIRFGTDPFSTGNITTQKAFTLTDNFKIYKGKHTFTIGTHNEFYSINNVFIPWNFGQYEYDSLDDFLTGAPAAEYQRIYSIIPGDEGVIGDESQAAANFNALQLGVYFQDQIEVNNKLNITAGLRLDMPILTDDPGTAPGFNEEILPLFQAQYEVANEVAAGQAPSGQLMFSPRIGFDYLLDNKGTILRGGVGIFTSRIPFVWPGAMYNNNGLATAFIGDFAIPGDVEFLPDPANQYVLENPTIPSGDFNLFTEDFRYPQVLRGNLAIDKQIGNGWFTTFEALYTKTLNNVVYTNINTDSTVDFNLTGSGDDRPVYIGSQLEDTDVSAVYVGSNTSEGYTYNLTAQVAKRFQFGLNLSLAYSFSEAKALNEGTSSQNSSQWRGQVNIDGRNNPVFGRSDFAVGHRIVGAADYTLKWSEDISTQFSLFYSGQNGTPFSYVIGTERNINNESGSTSRNRSLIYIPTDANDINLVDFMDGNTLVTAAEQYAALNELIENDPSLSGRRGQYAEKNGARAPWENIFDFAIRQDIGQDLGGTLHRYQISLDIFNVGNMLNSSWGTRYSVPGDFNNYNLYDFEGFEADGTTPRFTYSDEDQGIDRFDINGLSSRWSMRVGIRYILGE